MLLISTQKVPREKPRLVHRYGVVSLILSMRPAEKAFNRGPGTGQEG